MWTNTEMPDAATLADATSNPTVPGVASFNMCFNGTTWDRCVKAVDPCQVNTKSYANINGTMGGIFGFDRARHGAGIGVGGANQSFQSIDMTNDGRLIGRG